MADDNQSRLNVRHEFYIFLSVIVRMLGVLTGFQFAQTDKWYAILIVTAWAGAEVWLANIKPRTS